jgi:membrane-bound metal-dependent hydrolase YbcI (DUF457 family)
MDLGTQALASIAVARAVTPRAPWSAWGVIVVAGIIANVDFFSSMVSPAAYIDWHRTYTHSIFVTLIADAILAALYLYFARGARSEKTSEKPGEGGEPSSARFFAAVLIAGLLHIALDACQSVGTMIFWPFSSRRVAADWLTRFDPWIIAILLAALLLPELSRLVSDEIGAKSKKTRGRVGAIVGLGAVLLYVGVRTDLHSNAIAAMQARTYAGAPARRVGAYPDAVSPVMWHGIVETDNALRDLTVNALPGANLDPDNGVTLYKPEPSAILDRAQQSAAAKKFLSIAQFPKASVEQVADGYEVRIRDLRYAVMGDPQHEIGARMRMDANGKLLEDELIWVRELRRR